MNPQAEPWPGPSTASGGGAIPLEFRSVVASSAIHGRLEGWRKGGVMECVAAPAAPPLANRTELTCSIGAPIDTEQIAREAREQGAREALAESEARTETMLVDVRQGVKRALEEFGGEKQRYFAGLEREVVRLSLAIAERVLHRETAMDPTLLAGAARVALEQVRDESDAIVRVATEQFSAWQDMLGRECGWVRVQADATLQTGECVLETRSGTMELGVRAQLQEIERGFFELLGRKPGTTVS